MDDRNITRKLAAILSMDVKDYSRLMADDDVETVRSLKACRKLAAREVEAYGGRVVDSPGDNLLSEFVSVADAVQCAAVIQQAFEERNRDLPAKRRMAFRMGINLGDVIQDGDQIFGDGLNIAARLEGMAPGGGICISGSAFDQVKKLLSFGYEYLGEKSLKNISEKIPVYRVILNPDSPGQVLYACRHYNPRFRRRKRIFLLVIILALALGLFIAKHNDPARQGLSGPARIKAKLMKMHLPDRPSIAVLPFANMSRDPEQSYFSDGLTEDLITDLSQVSGLFVIARNSVAPYKNKAVKIQEVGRELGVRYVLEGSVRKMGDRVRISAQLVDATTEGHIWAQRYDRDLNDLFTVQDEVRKKIVTALSVELSQEDRDRMARKDPVNLEAYDYYLRGLELQAAKMIGGAAQARGMFEKALAIDPGYARAQAALGHTYLDEWIFGENVDGAALDKAEAMALKAIETAPGQSEGYGLLGHVYLWTHQHKKGIAQIRKAISLGPGNAEWLASLGEQLTWDGSPGEGIRYMEQAMRLDPNYPAWYLWNLGHAYYLNQEFEKAADIFKRALVKDPHFWPSHAYLALAFDALGQPEKVRQEIDAACNATLHIQGQAWEKRLPYKDRELAVRVVGRLKELGLK